MIATDLVRIMEGLSAEIELTTDIEALRALALRQARVIEQQREEHEAEVERLIEIVRLLKRKHFGKSSERTSTEQLGLFNEAEELASQDEGAEEADETIEVPAHKRGRPRRKPLPEDLPREDRIIELSESERRCPTDGSLMEEIGADISEKLDVIPMQLKVIRTIRKKYACRACQEGVKTAPLPVAAIPKGIASEGLLAAIITWKFCDHLPLYRIESIFSRHGMELSRGTMASWVVRMGQLVQPLVNLLSERLLDGNYLQMDETRVQVLREPGKRAESQSYMWVRARPDPDDPIVIFDYDPTRSGDVPKRLLEGFTGRLQVDGYDGYSAVCRREGIIRHGCMAHLRRKLFDASKSSKKPGIANKGLKHVQWLYKIEDQCRGWTAERRYALRQERALPILGELRSFITDTIGKIPESGLTGKALHYANNEWVYLERYVEDGRAEIDNNFVENQIRPFAVGRKNWLFSATVEGANASANIYSLISTVKLHGLDVYRYLRYIFELLPAASTLADLEQLLPAAVAIEFTRLDCFANCPSQT